MTNTGDLPETFLLVGAGAGCGGVWGQKGGGACVAVPTGPHPALPPCSTG